MADCHPRAFASQAVLVGCTAAVLVGCTAAVLVGCTAAGRIAVHLHQVVVDLLLQVESAHLLRLLLIAHLLLLAIHVPRVEDRSIVESTPAEDRSRNSEVTGSPAGRQGELELS